MWNDINITYNHPYHKTGAEATESVYMLRPNDAFMQIWDRTEPENVKSVLQTEVDKTAAEIKDKGNVSMSLPHLRIDRENGKIGITIIDGRHRTMAYRKLSKQVPVLIENDTGGNLTEIPELNGILSSNLPSRIAQQIKGEKEGKPILPEDEATFAYIRKWAKENEAKLKKQFIAKYGEFVGTKATEFYAKHGKIAPDHLIEAWKKEAKQKGHSIEPDQKALAELRTTELRAQFAAIVGGKHADTCVAVHLATGRPLHRDTINAIKDGLDLDSAMKRELADAQNLDPQYGINPQRKQTYLERSVKDRGGMGLGSR